MPAAFQDKVTIMTDQIETIDELFVHELQDLYSAEYQLTMAVPKMITSANAPELRSALAEHLKQTHQHLLRMERALDMAGHEPEGEVCHGIEGLITETEGLIDSTAYGPVLDGALIDAARKVEHYEITAYRATIAKAHEFGFTDLASLLEMNLQEEELADFRLQQLAEGMMPFSGPGPDPRDDGSEVIVGEAGRAAF